MTCRTALAIWAGCALLAVWAAIRAWDHFHGRPPLRPEWPEPADGGPVSIRWRQ